MRHPIWRQWVAAARRRALGAAVASRRRRRRRRPVPACLEQLEDRLAPAGTWTHIATPADLGTMFLLSNGTVMAQKSDVSSTWYHLTPDSTGSYDNGHWTTLPFMSIQRE